jgi:IS30 family transposase
MGHERERGLSGEQKRELWARWKRGETLVEIGRALGRSTPNVFTRLKAEGGIAPRPRTRRATALRPQEREEISRGLCQGLSLRAIGERLRRAPSTVSREVARNGGPKAYRANRAEDRAIKSAARPKLCVLARNKRLRMLVAEKLERKWSPQQIAGWLKAEHGGDEAMQVSHETIYKSLFVQARGALKRELLASLRSRRVMRRAKGARSQGMKRSLIADAVSIRERPAAIEDRAVPGHWEGDLLMGGVGSRIATLVERQSRFVMLVRLGAKTSDDVVAALARQVKQLPKQMQASLTWDRGSELTSHAKFTLATNVKVYFCDPQSPWQRGSNENTNGLLRQYFPKGATFANVTQAELNRVARELNSRPRKTLGYKTPAAIFAKAVAATG